jgi:hypothetical protein
MQTKKIKYDWKIGLRKTLKNTLITYGAPALLYVLNSYQEWMPSDKAAIAAPIIAMICYGLKNWIENK